MKKTSPSRTWGTLEYFRRQAWADMNRRTINGSYPNWKHKKNHSHLKKGIRLEMSKEEFYGFCDKKKRAIMRLYKQGRTPSLDRLDSEGPYAVWNLRIMCFSKNCARANRGRKKKNLTNKTKKP